MAAFNHLGQCVSRPRPVPALLRRRARLRVLSARSHPPDDASDRLLRLVGTDRHDACYLARDGLVLELLHFAGGGGEARARSGRVSMNEPGLTHISVSVDDIPATCARVRELGGEVLDNTDIGVAIFVRDPDGQLIELLPMSYHDSLAATGRRLSAVDVLHALDPRRPAPRARAQPPRPSRRRRRRRAADVSRARRPGGPPRRRARGGRRRLPATACCGSARTRSACSSCLLAAAKLGAMFCPANWRQTPDELAFVIDDLDPACGRLAGGRGRRDGARRRARGSRPTPAGSATTTGAPRRRPMGGDTYEAFLGGRPRRRSRSADVDPAALAAADLHRGLRRASERRDALAPRASPRAWCTATSPGTGRRRRVPEQRSDVPSRHAHAHARDVRVRRDERVPAAASTPRAVPDHRARSAARARSSSGRCSSRSSSQRGRPLRPVDPAHRAGGAAWNAMTSAATRARGPPHPAATARPRSSA